MLGNKLDTLTKMLERTIAPKAEAPVTAPKPEKQAAAKKVAKKAAKKVSKK